MANVTRTSMSEDCPAQTPSRVYSPELPPPAYTPPPNGLVASSAISSSSPSPLANRPLLSPSARDVYKSPKVLVKPTYGTFQGDSTYTGDYIEQPRQAAAASPRAGQRVYRSGLSPSRGTTMNTTTSYTEAYSPSGPRRSPSYQSSPNSLSQGAPPAQLRPKSPSSASQTQTASSRSSIAPRSPASSISTRSPIRPRSPVSPMLSKRDYQGPIDHGFRGPTNDSSYIATHDQKARQACVNPRISPEAYKEHREKYRGPTDFGDSSAVDSTYDSTYNRRADPTGPVPNPNGSVRPSSPLPFGGNFGGETTYDRTINSTARSPRARSTSPNVAAVELASRSRSPLPFGSAPGYQGASSTYESHFHSSSASASRRSPAPAERPTTPVAPRTPVSPSNAREIVPAGRVGVAGRSPARSPRQALEGSSEYISKYNKPVTPVPGAVAGDLKGLKRRPRDERPALPAGAQQDANSSYTRDFTQPGARSVQSSTTCELTLSPGEPPSASCGRGGIAAPVPQRTTSSSHPTPVKSPIETAQKSPSAPGPESLPAAGKSYNTYRSRSRSPLV